jgi:annexin A7/11
MFNMALSGGRDESPVVNHQLVHQDVEALFRAGPGQIGTVCVLLVSLSLSLSYDRMRLESAVSSCPDLMLISKRSPSNSHNAIALPSPRCRFLSSHSALIFSLFCRIDSEFSGHMRDGLHHIARGAEMDGQGIARDAELLEASMAGAGTKDERM